MKTTTEYPGSTSTKYLNFTVIQEVSDERKTPIYGVSNLRGNLIGHIKWFSPWRRFVLSAEEYCVFDSTCLTEITKFIKRLDCRKHRERGRD